MLGRRSQDRAASETVGTILLLVIAVVLAGVFTLTLFTLPGPQSSSHATLQAFAPPATDTVVLEHRGGPAIPLAQLTATVTVNGTPTQFVVGNSLGSGWSVVAADGHAKTSTESFAAGDQAIYTAPALWGATASLQVVDGAASGVTGAALALPSTTVLPGDATKPTFANARTTSTTTIFVNFTEPIRNMTSPGTPAAISPRDFTVEVLGVARTISSITLLGNGSSAELTVTPAFSTSSLPYVNSTASPAWTSDLVGNAFASSASVRAADGVAPTISGVGSSGVTTSQATVSWTTDEAASTNYFYAGPTQSLGFSAITGSGAGGTSHSATISGLTDNTQYFYQVVSTDAAGNTATSSQSQFTTTQLAVSGGGGSDPRYLSLPSGASVTSGVMSSGFTLTLKNSTGTITASSNVVVSLGTNSSLGQFFLDAAGTQPTTTVTILSGASSATFYYLDYRDGGNSILSANAEGVIGVATVVQVDLTSARSVPYHLQWTALPALPMLGATDVSGFTVTLKDSFDQDALTPWALTVNLSTNSTSGYFVSTGGSIITSVTLNGASSASFKYHDGRGGAALLMATANNTIPGAAAVTVQGNVGLDALTLNGVAAANYARLDAVQTWTAAQTYGAGLLKVTDLVKGSATLTLPTTSDTLAALGTAQSWSGVQTFGSGKLRLTGGTGATLPLPGASGTLLYDTATGQIKIDDGSALQAVGMLNKTATWNATQTFALGKLVLTGAGTGSLPQPATPGTLLFDTTTGQLKVDDGSALQTVGMLNKTQTWNAVQTFGTNAALDASTITGGTLGAARGGTGISGAGGSANRVLLTTDGSSWSAGQVALGTMVTGTLAAGNGGTGQSSYAVGDILYASGTSTLSKLADVATGNVLLSGGLNTAPSWGKVDLTAAVTGTLPASNGGTGVSGAGGTANRVLVTTDGSSWTAGQVNLNSAMVTGSIGVATGGTGLSSYTIGDLLYASGTTTLSKLADVATGNVLLSGGVGAAPSWGKVDLANAVTGTLGATSGGTGQSSYAVGDLLYASTTTALSKLAAGSTGTVLHANGAGVAPSWGQIADADVASGAAIAWSKISKSGAVAGDVGALGNATNTVGTTNLQDGSVTSAKTDFIVGLVTFSFDPPNTANRGVVCGTTTLTGALTTDYVVATPNSGDLNDAWVYHGARVSAANTVEVCVQNNSGGNSNPAAVNVYAIVFR